MDKSGKKRILLKIGSNTLTKETNHISRGKIEDIGMQIAALKDDYEFVIVSSGAIAAAKSSQVKFFGGNETAFYGCLIHQRENA